MGSGRYGDVGHREIGGDCMLTLIYPRGSFLLWASHHHSRPQVTDTPGFTGPTAAPDVHITSQVHAYAYISPTLSINFAISCFILFYRKISKSISKYRAISQNIARYRAGSRQNWPILVSSHMTSRTLRQVLGRVSRRGRHGRAAGARSTAAAMPCSCSGRAKLRTSVTARTAATWASRRAWASASCAVRAAA